MHLTATLRGWDEPQPPIAGVGARLEPNGVRVFALHVKKLSRAKTIKATLVTDAGERVVRLVWEAVQPGTYLDTNPDRPQVLEFA